MTIVPEPFDPGILRLAVDLRRRGVEPSRGGWHHVRHGVWVEAPVWSALSIDERYVAFVHATALRLTRTGRPVFALESAAALWRMPRIEPWPTFARVLTSSRAAPSSRLVRPHLGTASESVVVGGLRVTGAARTVVDLARWGSLPTAVAAADHALRFDLCTRDQLSDEVRRLPVGAPGRRAAALVRDFADGASMSPGESLSRVQLYVLNLPRPRLQVPYDDAEGHIGVVDFGWDGAIGEFDGRIKYGIPADATPEVASEILWREKKREDRLRRQAGVARWTWAVAHRPPELLRILAAVGIRPLPRCTWFDLGSKRAG